MNNVYVSPDLVFREDPEVTNSGETSVWWAVHQQYSTWNSIHKQHPVFTPSTKIQGTESRGGGGGGYMYLSTGLTPFMPGSK